MHGYELWAELTRREVEQWAAISRPQVYYSLRKLAKGKLIVRASAADASLGPDRTVYAPSAAGRRALSDALARDEWATRHVPVPFLTWMVLSWQARPADFTAQLARRKKYLESQIAFEKAALESIIEETSPTSDAAMIVRLAIRQNETELAWLAEVRARHRPG